MIFISLINIDLDYSQSEKFFYCLHILFKLNFNIIIYKPFIGHKNKKKTNDSTNGMNS